MPSTPNQNDDCHRTKAFHFFKIIHSDSLSDGKMRIPTKFVKRHGEGLPETVYLELPIGEQWKVNLEKQDGKIWFQKGWKEFLDYYSLSHGHLLVFKYEGTSHFDVLIFDMSTVEIDYPFNSTGGKIPIKDQAFQLPETEILEGCLPCRRRKHKSLPACHQQPLKKIRTKQDALERDDSVSIVFISGNPFFQVVMHQSNFFNRLNLPSMFCEKYFGMNKKQGNVILQVLDGKIWEVRYTFRKLGRYNKFEFFDGIKEFVEGNNLQVGDVCIFELVGRTKLTFKVSIFRKTDGNNCSSSQEFAVRNVETKITSTCSDSEEPALSQPPSVIANKEFHLLSRVPNTDRMSLGKRIIPQYDQRSSLSRFGAMITHTKFNSKYPFFESRINGLSPRMLWLPMSFVKRYINKDGKFAKLQVGEKSWSIKLVHYPNKAVFSTGWFSFARENGLKPGDVCIFELVNSDDIVMKVSISKHSSVEST